MRPTVYLIIALSLLWLLNSGHYNGLLLSLGALSVAFVVLIAKKMDVIDQEAKPLRFTLMLPIYWVWLTREIIYSNIDVVKKIWQGNTSIDPKVATLKLTQRSDIAKVVYANSVTLTPGTVTIDLTEDEITVHALTASGIESLKSGDMDRRVTRLER